MLAAVIVLSLACAALSAALALYVRDDIRRRQLQGAVTPSFRFLPQHPDFAREVATAVNLSIAAVVKQSLRARTRAGITYREGAYDALSLVLKTVTGVSKPKE